MQYEYLWADGVKIKKPLRLSAPEYIDKLFDWVEAQVRPGLQFVHVPDGSQDWDEEPGAVQEATVEAGHLVSVACSL